MKHPILFAALIFTTAAPALASTCASSFQRKGNPFVGTTYTASITLPDLSVGSAIGQVSSIARSSNMDILSEDAQAGAMLIEVPQSMAQKPIPLIVSATRTGNEGTVVMRVKFEQGALSSGNIMRNQMCGLLDQIKSGAAGQQLARSAPKASTINATADLFASQLTDQNRDNPAAIEARYKGKVYAISGRVNRVLKDGSNYNTSFDTSNSSAAVDYQRVVIGCTFAPDQAAYALALRPRERVTLTGVVDGYDQIKRILWLKACKAN